jgi:hypothetical protein
MNGRANLTIVDSLPGSAADAPLEVVGYYTAAADGEDGFILSVVKKGGNRMKDLRTAYP